MNLRLMLLLLGLIVLAWIYLRGSRELRRRAQLQRDATTAAPALAATSGTDAAGRLLYVKATDARCFTGAEIRNALEDADMQSGEMDIFHYYGDGDDCGDRRVLVSAADMYEPGTLAIARLDQLETRGLVLFLVPGDGTRAQLAQCARAVAAGLCASVFDADMRLLDRETLAGMCEDESARASNVP